MTPLFDVDSVRREDRAIALMMGYRAELGRLGSLVENLERDNPRWPATEVHLKAACTAVEAAMDALADEAQARRLAASKKAADAILEALLDVAKESRE